MLSVGTLAGDALYVLHGQGIGNVRGQDSNLTYSSGQSVVPAYEGWEPNPDGSFDMFFGYLNRNWREELDIPIGADNDIEPAPYGPDGGQPTHFLPRNNRWQFRIRVPSDWGTKELVWTLTSHGQTYRAYGTLRPGYVLDEQAIQREFVEVPPVGNEPPKLHVDGQKTRTHKVGQPVTLTATASDDGLPIARDLPPIFTPPAPSAARSGRGIGPETRSTANAGADPNGGVLGNSHGLRVAWFVYRGSGRVTFDPPQFKVWEDQRGGSPWSPGWVRPPVPPGGKWVVQATFLDAGTYVLRCLAHDGNAFRYEDVTFTVTP